MPSIAETFEREAKFRGISVNDQNSMKFNKTILSFVLVGYESVYNELSASLVVF